MAAHRSADHSAAESPGDESNDELDRAGLPAVPSSWEAHASTQGKVTADVIRASKSGQIFALEDRNSFAHTTWRRVFVTVDRHHGKIFLRDQHGAEIDEPSEGVRQGVQPLDAFLEELDEHNEYYRAPVLRRAPRQRSALPASPGGQTTTRL